MVVVVIVRRAHESVMVFLRPRVHVDLEASRGDLVTHRILDAHGDGVRFFQR